MPLSYRDFYYPLNVFMHVLTLEEGRVAALHYGLFERGDEPIALAQRRSTDLLLSRLPAPPATLLEVGIGLGDTLAELTRLGYAATGITPDEKQIAVARERHGEAMNIQHAALETFVPRHPERSRGICAGGGEPLAPTQPDPSTTLGMTEPFDVVIFQESSQYIDANTLWRRMRELAKHRVIVLDEFSVGEGGTLHSLARFLAQAELHGFRKIEELDLTDKAAPTIDYFSARLPRYRQTLIDDLGLTNEQVDELIAGGVNYRHHYDRGVYGYRLLVIERAAAPSPHR